MKVVKLTFINWLLYLQSHIEQYIKIPLFNVKHNIFRNNFFNSTIIESNRLNADITNSENVGAFKKSFSIHKANSKLHVQLF